MRIGLVSDTHGLLRPEAIAFLRGSDCIVHAGDIGGEAVLDALRGIAPVHAIGGNNDLLAGATPETLALEAAGLRLYVIHDAKDLRRFPAPAGTHVIVCGHSHQPLVQRLATGELLVNPGSAGPRRFKLPVSAGELVVADGVLAQARTVELL